MNTVLEEKVDELKCSGKNESHERTVTYFQLWLYRSVNMILVSSIFRDTVLIDQYRRPSIKNIVMGVNTTHFPSQFHLLRIGGFVMVECGNM